MGMESMPNPAEEETKDNVEENDEAEKWLEFVDGNGRKTQVAVFEGETDEEALARARAIDDRLGEVSAF